MPANEPQVAPQVEQYATNLGPQLQYMGQTVSRDEALQRLRIGQVDMVVVYPPHAYETVQNGSQAVLELYHNEIDPTQAAYVDQLGQVYVGEMNRRILMLFAGQAKDGERHGEDDLQEARASADRARAACGRRLADRAGGTCSARTARSTTRRRCSAQPRSSWAGWGKDSGATWTLRNRTPRSAIRPASITRADQADRDLSRLDQQLAEFEKVPADVMVSPLTTETKTIATFTPSFVTFYAPGVLCADPPACGDQHRVARAGPRESVRRAGVVPGGSRHAFEILLGKYGSYIIFVGFLALILTASMIFLLGVPLLGTIGWLVLSLFLLVFSSLGIGFAISATSGTDSQAVQASMLVLLAAMFFSGFVFPLNQILVPVRYIGYLLPVTYGIQNLQNVMLKGIPPNWIFLVALGVMGVVLFVFSWWRYRRSMVRV